MKKMLLILSIIVLMVLPLIKSNASTTSLDGYTLTTKTGTYVYSINNPVLKPLNTTTQVLDLQVGVQINGLDNMSALYNSSISQSLVEIDVNLSSTLQGLNSSTLNYKSVPLDGYGNPWTSWNNQNNCQCFIFPATIYYSESISASDYLSLNVPTTLPNNFSVGLDFIFNTSYVSGQTLTEKLIASVNLQTVPWYSTTTIWVSDPNVVLTSPITTTVSTFNNTTTTTATTTTTKTTPFPLIFMLMAFIPITIKRIKK